MCLPVVLRADPVNVNTDSGEGERSSERSDVARPVSSHRFRNGCLRFARHTPTSAHWDILIIDAHHALPVASVWGSTSRTSSDGQFFASGRRNAGEINAKYGPDPGLKIYSFLSGRYGSFHSQRDCDTTATSRKLFLRRP